MRAAVYDEFGGRITIRQVPDPVPRPDDVIVRVRATGVCRSDWHGWQGHDADIAELPHVPGHEMVGEVAAVGAAAGPWQVGDRVTTPFVAGCGRCDWCDGGDPQVCPDQAQPGFTHWGSFAEFVRVRHAAHNLVHVPDAIDDVAAASLGCRFTTAYRAIVSQGRIDPGQWLAVHGCGGVGLSAVMIGAALGARVAAVDPNPAAIRLAAELGAEITLGPDDRLVDTLVEITDGGAHVSIDAVGDVRVVADSVASLRRRGRHVQVGLLVGTDAAPAISLGRVIGHELELLGSHGIAPSDYAAVFHLVAANRLDLGRLVGRTCDLADGAEALMSMPADERPGMTVITDL